MMPLPAPDPGIASCRPHTHINNRDIFAQLTRAHQRQDARRKNPRWTGSASASKNLQMPELETIAIAPHLTFDALVAGKPGAPLVLLLHGFAESMQCWRAQVAALADADYRAIAPSQRGYSPGARPDVKGTANYHIDRLMDDAMAIVAASGYGDRRFHLAGHDWGGSIAWSLADRYPERIASLTVLSRPHPNAFNRALLQTDGEQAQRSRHHKWFLEPDAADVVLADDCKWLRERLSANGVPEAAIERHLAVLGNKDAMEGALAWYRARGSRRGRGTRPARLPLRPCCRARPNAARSRPPERRWRRAAHAANARYRPARHRRHRAQETICGAASAAPARRRFAIVRG